jgi:hypothetical protein
MTNKTAGIITLLVLLLIIIAAASTRINDLQSQVDRLTPPATSTYDPCSPADDPEYYTEC